MFLIFYYCISFRSTKEAISSTQNMEYADRNRDLGIYTLLAVLLITLGLTRALLFFQVMLKATMSIHLVMFDALMRAPIYFFDTNSIGKFTFSSHKYIF